MRLIRNFPFASPPAAGSIPTTPVCRPVALRSPLRHEETIDLSPEDGRQYNLHEGDKVRVTSRRGSVIAPVRFDPGLRPGLAFLTMHFPDQVATNDLTIDAVDPKSGTSEFKATAIRIEKCLEQ